MHIYLVDLGLKFGIMQDHALHMARFLRDEGVFMVTLCCPANSKLAEKAKESEIPVLAFTNQKANSFSNILKLFFACRKTKNCIIHTFSHKSPLLGWRVYTLLKKNSTILIHTHKNVQELAINKKGKMPKYWREAHIIICDSKHTGHLLMDAGINPSNIGRISAGLNTKVLAKHVPSKRRRFVFGVLSPKGAVDNNDIIIKAMSGLWHCDNLPPWEIRVFGKDLDLNHILQLAISLGVESRLSIIGNQDLATVLPWCNALIVPCSLPTGARRYLGMAWYTECGLICPQTAPNLELVRNNENALTYNAGDPQYLSSVMKQIMGAPELLTTIINNGKYMQAAVGIDRTIGQCNKLYRECIAKRGWILSQPKKITDEKTTENDS